MLFRSVSGVLTSVLKLSRAVKFSVDPCQMGMDVQIPSSGSECLQPVPHYLCGRNSVRAHAVEQRRRLMGDQSAQILGVNASILISSLFCSSQCLRQHNGTFLSEKLLSNPNEKYGAGHGRITSSVRQGESSPPPSTVRCSPPVTARSAPGSSPPSSGGEPLSRRC